MVAATVAAFAAAAGPQPERAVAAVVERVAHARALTTTLVHDGRVVTPDPRVLDVDVDLGVLEAAGPWLPGMVREVLMTGPSRRRGGVHHTAPEVARAVTGLALTDHDLGRVRVGDPSVGGGAFLLAAAERLAGHAPIDGVMARLCGVDVDPLAVAVTTAALELWAGVPPGPDRIRVADFLEEQPFGELIVDVVVGNPPFLGQLRGSTVRSSDRNRVVRRRWSGVGGYVDEAALFLLAGMDAVAAAGSIGLVQPVSMLSARDAAPVRERLLREGSVVALWFDGERVFGAGVDTCAVVIRKGATAGPVRRVVGVAAEVAADHPAIETPTSWAGLVADLSGVPRVELADRGLRLGDVAFCTAGFRDQFYGLRDAVTDSGDGEIRLITSGLIDPLTCRWGTRPCRYDRRRWAAPTVDRARIEPGIADWVAERLRPKLVVASQTRVLEVAVDETGSWIPCTPVVSVEPRDDAPSLWHLAAALTAPQASAWLAAGASGSALSRNALRVAASRLAELPLPAVGAAWDHAAVVARAAHDDPTPHRLRAAGVAAAAAYGDESADLVEWWANRLPDLDRGRA